MSFYQQGPQLGNQYLDDDLLRSCLARRMPKEPLRQVEPLFSGVTQSLAQKRAQRGLPPGEDHPMVTALHQIIDLSAHRLQGLGPLDRGIRAKKAPLVALAGHLNISKVGHGPKDTTKRGLRTPHHDLDGT